MTLFQILAVRISLTALFSYVNHRFFKLPSTVGVMLISLVASLALIGLDRLGIHVEQTAERILQNIEFDETLMQGMLSFLLSAGALQVDLSDLAEQKVTILILATVGVML